MSRLFALLSAVAALALLVFAVNLFWFRPFAIDHFFLRYMVEDWFGYPESITYVDPLGGTPFDWYNSELDQVSVERREARVAWLADMQRLLRGYDRDALSGQQLLSRDILDHQLANELADAAFPEHGFVMTQQDGAYLHLISFLTGVHPLASRANAGDYLARLAQVPRKLEQELVLAQRQGAAGIRLPRIIVEKVISNLENILAPAPADQPLVTEYRAGLADLVEDGVLDQDEADRLAAEALRLTTETVLPAYRRLLAWQRQQLADAPTAVGAWALPDGAAWYARKIADQTTTDLDADAIHQLGLAEVDRISAEMDSRLRALGYSSGTVGARMRAFALDPEQQFEDSAAGREELLDNYRAIVAEASQRIDGWIANVPDVPVEVRRVPEYAEATAPGAYYTGPSPDGSRPGIFWANLHDISSMPRWYLRTLAYHEATPGHHLESVMSMTLTGVAEFRKWVFYSAYSEGWALYSERLAWEAGLHPTPATDLGRLRDELFRAVRLVVDTGLHAKRWTRQQAIDYLGGSTGMADAEVVSEIDRYIVDPGQALGYKLGMQRILELRSQAKAALGDAFDLRHFHGVVLGNGAMPLDLLEQQVAAWIARGGGAP